MRELHLVDGAAAGAEGGVSRPLQVLIVEDSAEDALVLASELRAQGVMCEWQRVETVAAIVAELRQRRYDVVLSDFSLSGLDGVAALEAVRSVDRTLPFIAVSGAIGEERVVSLLRAGANDFVSKGNIARLGIAVRAAIAAAEPGERYAVLADVAGRLLSSEDPVEVLDELCRMVMDQVDGDLFLSYVVDAPAACLRLNAAGGVPAERLPALERLPLGEGVCGRVAAAGRPIVIERLDRRPDSRAELLRSLGVRAFACHPLVAAGSVLGTLAFGTARRGWFTSGDLDLMRSVAEHVAVAIDRRRALDTAERRAREAEQSARSLQAVLDISDAVTVADAGAGTIRAISRAVRELFQAPGDVVGMPVDEYCEQVPLCRLDGSPAPKAELPLFRAINGEVVHGEEWMLARPSGDRIRVAINAGPIRDAGGKITGAVATWRDVSPVRAAEAERESLLEALAAANELLEARVAERTAQLETEIAERQRVEQERKVLLDRVRAERRTLEAVLKQMPSGVSIAEAPSGKLLFHNEQAETLLGHPMLPAVHYRDYADFGAQHADGTPYRPEEYPIARALLGETVYREEMIYRRGDGSRTDFVVSAAPVRNPAGEIVAAVSIFDDVTERKRTEAALGRSELLLAQAVEMAHLGAWELQLGESHIDANPLLWSDEVFRIFGYEPGSVAVTNELFFGRVHPDDRAKVREAVARAFADRQPYAVEHRIVRPDGEERVVVEHAELQLDEVGRPVRMVGAVQDVTELKKAEQALRESHEQLEARVRQRTVELEQVHERLRELSRGLVEVQEEERRAVARELHDEAGQVLTALKINLRLLDDESANRESARRHISALQALAGEAMERIHAVGQRMRPAALDRAGLVPALAQVIADATRAGVAADLEATGFDRAGRLPVEVETTVYRVIQESVANVIRHAGARRLSVVLERGERAVVALVEDDGRGFDRAARPDGNHVGLDVMRARVELVGGRLAIESEPGAGTVVRLEVPSRLRR